MVEFVSQYREDEDNPTSTSILPRAKSSNRQIDIDSWRFGSTMKEDQLTRYLKAPIVVFGDCRGK